LTGLFPVVALPGKRRCYLVYDASLLHLPVEPDVELDVELGVEPGVEPVPGLFPAVLPLVLPVVDDASLLHLVPVQPDVEPGL
jgi:hypothetical protein